MRKKVAHSNHLRILALDLHPRRFGYVVMEKPGKLLDWGVRRSYLKQTNHTEVLIERRLRPLLQLWAPDVVIVRVGTRRNVDVQTLFRQIKKQVRGHLLLPVRDYGHHFTGATKHECAEELTARFPEIGWKLPPKRKPWESDHYSVSIFEALAAAIALSKY